MEQRFVKALQEANHRDYAQAAGLPLLLLVYATVALVVSVTLPPSGSVDKVVVSYILWTMLALAAAIVVSLAAAQDIARVSRRHAADVFARTDLILFAMMLDSDPRQERTRRHDLVLAAAGAKTRDLTTMKERLLRLAQFFQNWCRLYGTAPRSPLAGMLPVLFWTVPLVILVTVATIVLAGAHIATPIALNLLVYIALQVLPAGRRIGIRLALIDFFNT